MEIPLIYILIGAEFLLIFFGLAITFGIMLLRRPAAEAPEEVTEEVTEEPVEVAQTSYLDYLEQAMQRNAVKLKQQENIEAEPQEDDASDDSADVIELDEVTPEGDTEDTENTGEDTPSSPPPDEAQSALLQARENYLQIEKAAAEKSEHEIHFWDSIYEGMQAFIDSLKTHEVVTEDVETSEIVVESKAAKEKVFYIETQGKKIDGEVNRLKDIIFEQENALNSMKKALSDEDSELNIDEETVNFLKEQLENIERQLSDSKMCMEVMEMENNRLQEEIDQLEAMTLSMSGEQEDSAADSGIDIEQMKQNLAQQEERIQQLLEAIESLELEASQAEKLKQTLNDFTRSSQEMINCIAILEEENERLQEAAEHPPEAAAPAEPQGGEDTQELKSKISSLEEELIKKDVAYAQLQDEFSSMETEYLAMYEAMHGDGS